MANIPDKTPATEADKNAAELRTQDTPATDDGIQQPEAGADPEAAASGEDGAGQDQPEKVESPRDRLARRYAEKRKEEIEGQGGTIYDQAAQDEQGAADAAPAATPAATDDKTPAPAAGADDPVHKLKVHGREIELPLSEIVKQAQINIATSAAERALSDLTRQINERRQELSSLSKPAPQPTATNGDGRQAAPPPAPAPDKPTQLDPARLAEIAEDIRNGTDEDASQALVKLVTEITEAVKPAAGAQPVDVAKVVTQTIEARLAGEREREEINSALTEFASTYPEIAGNEDLEVVAYTRAVAEMLRDIEKAGASPKKMAELRAANVTEVATAHRKLRTFVDQNGNQPYAGVVRSYGEVLAAAGDHIRAKFGRTAPAPQQPAGNGNGLSARTDLKRGLTPQPRTTQHRTQAEAAAPPGGRPDAKAAVSKIASLRRGHRPAVGV